MTKTHKALLIILFTLSLAPLTFAAQKSPLYIKKGGTVYTRTANQGIVANLTICNREKESVKFVLDVENATVQTHYKRNMYAKAISCQKQSFKFKNPFAVATNDGDEMVFTLKQIKDEDGEKYNDSKGYLYTVKDGDPSGIPCGDEMGRDGDYELCVGDFLTHELTGVRMKVTGYDGKKTDLLVTGLRWGEVKKVRIYKNYSKKIIAADEKGTRLELTHTGRSENGNVILTAESLK